MLNITDLAYGYDDESFRFDLNARSGEILAVAGPSGAGKTTLLLLIGGYLRPSAGSIMVNNRNITALDPGERPVSTIFQEHNLFPHLNVFQNVALGLNPGLKLNNDQRERVQHALERCHMTGYLKRLPGELSGGQRQRVSLARVLARRQPVLLLDEALTALGPALRQEILALLSDLVVQEAMTAIMVSHYPEDIHQVADRVAFLEKGEIREQVSKEELSDNRVSDAFKSYLGN